MTTQLSTKVGLCTHFSVSGNWMKQCVSCLKYYFTLSLPFEQRLVFRLCCDVQNVVSIIISTQYRSFLRFFSWHLVINMGSLCRLCNTRLRAPVIPRFVSNEPPCHTRHGASHIAVQPSLQAVVYLKYWVRSGQKATPTVSSLDFLISFFVSFQ